MEISPYHIKAAWQPSTIQQDTSWQQSLKPYCTELQNALAAYKNLSAYQTNKTAVESGHLLPKKEEFHLPSLAPLLKQSQTDLENGLGIALFTHFPIQENQADNKILFGGLLSHIGDTQPQTIKKELIQSVQDEGQANLDERRGSKHNLGLPVHNDGCDVVGFFCTQTPIQGGETILVSAAAVHNAMLKHDLDALKQLYQPYTNAWQDYLYPTGKNTRNNQLPRTWTAPIFSQSEGKMYCRYSRFYIDRAQTFDGIPPLTEEQLIALNQFDQYLYNHEDWQYRRSFKKGDILLINNHVVFHSRTAYVNGSEPNQRRHLYRAWMATPNSRSLDTSMACFFGNVAPGSQRGGVKREFLVD